MKEIAIEDITVVAIVTFCENAAELGCPRDKEVDMWFRELCADDYPEAQKVAGKLLDIIQRDADDTKKDKVL